MAHWSDKSPFNQLKRFAQYGVRGANVGQPSGPVQGQQAKNRSRFPLSVLGREKAKLPSDGPNPPLALP